MELEVQRTVAQYVAEGVCPSMVAEIDSSSSLGARDGTIDRHEFLSFMLVRTGQVEAYEIQKVSADNLPPPAHIADTSTPPTSPHLPPTHPPAHAATSLPSSSSTSLPPIAA